jgi:hypothetical protein
LAPDGKGVVLIDGNRARLRSLADGKALIDYGEAAAKVPLAVDAGGKYLAFGRGNDVVLSDLPSGKELGILKSQGGEPLALGFGPEGKSLVVLAPGTVAVWDVATRTRRVVGEGLPRAFAWTLGAEARLLVLNSGAKGSGGFSLYDLAPLLEYRAP